VSSIADAEKVDAPPFEKLIYLTQTTLSVDETQAIVDSLRARFPHLEDPPASDICYATQNRQDALKSILGECSVVYIIGSSRSSNTKSLKQVAESHGVSAHLIGGPDDLDLDTLPKSGSVGVVSGASAPEEMVEGVIEKLRQNGACYVEESIIREENVLFPLPKQLMA
jgi:4-hydroxy-3-methylbut-2-enyl diphosphate reductase